MSEYTVPETRKPVSETREPVSETREPVSETREPVSETRSLFQIPNPLQFLSQIGIPSWSTPEVVDPRDSVEISLTVSESEPRIHYEITPVNPTSALVIQALLVQEQQSLLLLQQSFHFGQLHPTLQIHLLQFLLSQGEPIDEALLNEQFTLAREDLQFTGIIERTLSLLNEQLQYVGTPCPTPTWYIRLEEEQTPFGGAFAYYQSTFRDTLVVQTQICYTLPLTLQLLFPKSSQVLLQKVLEQPLEQLARRLNTSRLQVITRFGETTYYRENCAYKSFPLFRPFGGHEWYERRLEQQEESDYSDSID